MIVILGRKGWDARDGAMLRYPCGRSTSHRLVKLSVLWLDAITCFAAGAESIVAHNGSVTSGKHETKATCTD